MPRLIAIFRNMPDPRGGNAPRHDLLDILTMALAASVWGAEICVDFTEFAEDRELLLREFLTLENGLPSHDTFSRVFRLLDPAALGQAFAAFLDDLGAHGPGLIAIDGKTLRRSFDRAAGRSALHVVTAFGTGARVSLARVSLARVSLARVSLARVSLARVSLGQRAVAEGQNEITAAPALLATLTLDGALVTGDAIRAQAETAQMVLDHGGASLFALKANRPAMLEAVEAVFAAPPASLEVFETTDADHGRIEIRRHRVTHLWTGSSATDRNPARPACRAWPASPRSPRPATTARLRPATASPPAA